MRFVLVLPKAYTYGCARVVEGGEGCAMGNGIAGARGGIKSVVRILYIFGTRVATTERTDM